MLDSDLAMLYGVETKVLNQTVKRNITRFPSDFMFKLTNQEYTLLRSQIVTLKGKGAHSKYPPNVFTEHGTIMIASLLNSPRAVAVSIQVVRTFVKLRSVLSSHKELAKKIEDMEAKYDEQFRLVFTAIKALMAEEEVKPRTPIGFKTKK
jgi:ORF6N domain.